MNYALFAAGILAILVGLIHAILGEILIFKRLRKNSIVPNVTRSILHTRHISIIWATWHIATLFGWSIAGVLILFSLNTQISDTFASVIHFIAFGMLASSCLVLFATKGKHPGWIGLLAVAILCWIS